MGANLVTKAEYKAYAGISSINQDAIIDSLIPAVSAFVKAICRRTFVDYVINPKVEYFKESGDTYIPLESPILAVSELGVSTDYGSTYTPLTAFTDYVWDRQYDTIRSIGADFNGLINGYMLSYTAGYAELPVDLKLAIFDLVTYYMKNDSAVHSNKAPGTNTVQVEYITTTGLPAHIRRVLDLYTHSYA